MPNHTTPQEIKLFNNQIKPQEIRLDTNQTKPQEIKLYKNQTKPQEIKLYTNQTKPDLSFRLWIPINRLSLQLIDNLLSHEAPTSTGQKLGSSECQKSLWDQWVQPPCVPHQLAAKNVFRLKLLLLTCSILFFVFFWGLRGQILGALGSVYIALLVS